MRVVDEPRVRTTREEVAGRQRVEVVRVHDGGRLEDARRLPQPHGAGEHAAQPEERAQLAQQTVRRGGAGRAEPERVDARGLSDAHDLHAFERDGSLPRDLARHADHLVALGERRSGRARCPNVTRELRRREQQQLRH